MKQSEIKLIHFDGAYFFPWSIPLMHIDAADMNTFYDGSKFDHLRRIFREETNREELFRSINGPLLCQLECTCGMPAPTTAKAIVSHIFSQPHMCKYIQKRGSISSRDFSFWMNLLKMFPKERSRASKQKLPNELSLFSTTLDLHSRKAHWTVEVSSAIEHEAAMCHFISACFSRSELVYVYVRDEEEANQVKEIIRMRFSISTNVYSVGNYLWYLLISGPNGHTSATQSVVFLRPPVNNVKDYRAVTRSPDAAIATNGSVAPGFCAFALCVPCVNSSLMLINGNEEMSAFRAFEKIFLQKSRLLPIHDVAALRDLDETAMVKRSTEDRSSTPSSAKEEIPDTVASKEKEEPATVPCTTTQTIPKTVVSKGRRQFCEVEKSVPDPEKWIENISTINETEMKKWPEIFSPFDEEMGKDVEYLLVMMTKTDA